MSIWQPPEPVKDIAHLLLIVSHTVQKLGQDQTTDTSVRRGDKLPLHTPERTVHSNTVGND